MLATIKYTDYRIKEHITFEFSDNYSGIHQNSMCNVGSAQKTQNARGAREIAFAVFLFLFYLTTSLLKVSLKIKDNISSSYGV